MNTYTASAAAKKLGVSVKTLQRWDREGKLVPARAPSNRRLYTEEQLVQAQGLRGRATPTATVAYVRVSTQAQKPDLANQRKALEAFCAAKGYTDVEYIEEIGGGMNFNRPKFRKLMARVHACEVARLVVAHKDRLARFGFAHLAWECSEFGCAVEVLNAQTLSPEQEMVEDLMTIVHCFSSRLCLLRNYKKTLQEVLK